MGGEVVSIERKHRKEQNINFDPPQGSALQADDDDDWSNNSKDLQSRQSPPLPII